METSPVPESSPSAGERIRSLILLGTAICLYFLAMFQRIVIPGSIFSELQADLNVSAAAVTGLGAAFMYAYAATQLFTGILSDKFGGYRVITVGAILFCLGSLLFPMCRSIPPLLYLCRAVTGIGAGTIFLSVVKEIQRAFPSRFGPVVGLAIMIGCGGAITASGPFVLMVRGTGWNAGLIAAGAVTALVTLLFLGLRFTVRMPAPTGIRFRIQSFFPAMRKRHNWRIFLMTGISMAIYYSFQTLLGKKFLEDYCSMSAVAAGWVLAASWILAAAANFGMPLLSRLMGERRKPFMLFMAIGTLISAGGLIPALVFEWRMPWFFISLFILLAICSNMSPVFLSILRETNPPDNLGICASLSNFVPFALIALLGNLAGFLMELFEPVITDEGVRVYGTHSYIAVFLLYTLFALIGLFLAFGIRETRGQHLDVD